MTPTSFRSSTPVASHTLARNTLLNLAGQVAAAAMGVATVPWIVRGLGTERFGLLALAWVILGYFTVFDLGLGRATTKYVAEELGRGGGRTVPDLLWTSAVVQGCMGVAGAVVLYAAAPMVVERLIRVPTVLAGETQAMLRMLAPAIPVTLLSGSFAGVLEAHQRFDLLNAVRIPASAMLYVVGLGGALLGLGLPEIVATLVVVRVLALAIVVLMVIRVIPVAREIRWSSSVASRLFRYGGWVTVSNLLGPVLVYLDRFLLASLLSVAAVAYYTAPYEAVTRLWIIPGALAATLFPAFSSLQGAGAGAQVGRLMARSIKYVLLALGPVAAALVLFAPEVLRVWLGPEFAAHSAGALRFLACGVLVNSVAFVPYAVMQGLGRADLTAKFHLIELPVYVLTAWFFIGRWGVTGAGAAWSLRVLLDAFLLLGTAIKLHPTLAVSREWRSVRSTAKGLAALMVVGVTFRWVAPVSWATGAFLLAMAGFTIFIWRVALDDADRKAILQAVRP